MSGGVGEGAKPPPRHTVVLQTPHGEIRLAVAEDQTILDAALRAGVDLPNSCCQGWCLTCAGRLVAGRVIHPTARRLYPQDTAAGFVLPCTAQPCTDCTILTHQKAAMRQWRRRHGLPMPGS